MKKFLSHEDENVINEEIAANCMFDVLTNEQSIREIVKSDKTLAKKLSEIIGKIITDLKTELELYFSSKTEANAIKNDIAALDRIKDIFDTILWSVARNDESTEKVQDKNKKSETKNKSTLSSDDKETKNTRPDIVRTDVVAEDAIVYSLQDDLKKFNPENKDIDTILNEILASSVSFEGRYLYFGRFDIDFIDFLKSKGINIQELPILMNYRDAYLSMQSKENGIYKSDNINYHNIGICGMKSAISEISRPTAIMRSKKNDNKIELALSFTDYKGNKGLAIVELNAAARNFRTHLTAHIVNSVYGKRNIESYIQKAKSDGRLLKNNSEEFSQVKAQVQYKSVINDNSSDNITIPHEVQSVNSSISENGENDTVKLSLQENYAEYEKPITREDIEDVQRIPEKSINDFSSDEIISTQKWAHKFYKQLGAKSPFFRAWFGDWREFDTTPIKVARKLNTDNQRPYSIKNSDTDWNIQVSGKVFNETNAHRSKNSVYAVPYLSYLDDIIKYAVLLDTYSVGKTKSENSLFFHNLYSVVDIGNGNELIKLYVEEIFNPNSTDSTRRAYKLLNIEKQQFGVKGSGVFPSLITQTVVIENIADLYAYVKSKDAKFNHKSANSILLSDDGTPKKFYHGTSDSFYEFNTDEISYREGSFFFAENMEDAESYGNKVISVYLTAENLADYDNQTSEFYRLENKKAQVDWLKQKGYDGWYADFDSDGWGEVSVFYPNQIKSADKNIGTFDKKSNDIRYSLQENKEIVISHEELLKENKELREANKITGIFFLHPEKLFSVNFSKV